MPSRPKNAAKSARGAGSRTLPAWRQGAVVHAGPFAVAEIVHEARLHLPRHAHEKACVHFVVEGLYQETIEGTGTLSGPGGFLFKPPDAAHCNEFAGAAVRSLRIEIAPGERARGRGPLLEHAPELALLGYRMLHEYRQAARCDASALALEELCLAALERLQGGSSGERPARSPAVLRAARFLEENASDPIQLATVAAHVGLHRSHLARSFHHHFHCTMGEYLRRRRVELVARALEEGREPLAGIAVRAGFTDQSHLTRVFRARMGVTPARFRRAVSGGAGRGPDPGPSPERGLEG